MASLGKLKCHDSSDVISMAEKTSQLSRRFRVFMTSRIYPCLGLCVPQVILEDSTLTIAIINVMFYYSATLAVCKPRARGKWFAYFVEFLHYTPEM